MTKENNIMPKEFAVQPIDPKTIDPTFGTQPGSDVGRFTPVQVDATAAMALLLATDDGAPKDALNLGARLRLAIRAAHQPLSGMGVSPDVLAGIYRSADAERRIYHQVDLVLSQLAMCGASALQEFAGWALDAVGCEARLLAEIREKEAAVENMRRVMSAYHSARATATPATPARR